MYAAVVASLRGLVVGDEVVGTRRDETMGEGLGIGSERTKFVSSHLKQCHQYWMFRCARKKK